MSFGLLLAGISVPVFLQTSAEPEDPRDIKVNSIQLISNGVARKTENRSRIFCHDMEWRTRWKTDAKGNITELEILYFTPEKVIFLETASKEFMGFAEDFNSMSAICNSDENGKFKKSTLIISAHWKAEDGPGPILAKLEVDRKTGKYEWIIAERN